MTGSAIKFAKLSILFVALQAEATLLYYDGFPTGSENAYPVGQLANNSNPAHASIVGFKDNANNKWSAGSTANQIWSDTLSYPSGIALTTQSGEYTCGRGSGSPRGAYRTFSNPTLKNSILYYSFLMRHHGSFPNKYSENFVAFGSKGISGTTAPYSKNFGEEGFVISMTNMGDHVEMHFKTEADARVLLTQVAAGSTYFVVVKYENTKDSPHVISASVLTEPIEPTTWDATITTAVRSSYPTLMQVGGFGANSTVNYWEFDEIRIGTTFADVAGTAATGTPAVFDGDTTLSAVGYDEGNATAHATFLAAFTDAGSPAAEVRLYWGDSNGSTSAESWHNSVSLGTLDGLSVSRTIDGLDLNKTYYYRFAAINGNVVTWGTPAQAAFVTAEMTPTEPQDVDECEVDPASVTLSPGFVVGANIPVYFEIGGTAVSGTDYTTATSSPLTLVANDSSATCDIYPIRDFTETGARSVSLTVLPGPYILPSATTVQFNIVDATLPAAPTNAFLGTVSSLASVAENWSLGHVPAADETVLYDLRYGRVDMQWDAAAPKAVGSWLQPENQTNRVVFATTVAEPLQIAGDATLAGGFWTQEGPSANPEYSLSLAIGGNLAIGTSAAINVGCPVSGIDPLAMSSGWFRSGPGYVSDSGGAFGGESYGAGNGLNDNCYGAILNPLTWGASARGSGAIPQKYAGPGLVNLSVAGTLSLTGGIYANGYAYGNNGGGASGGAINLTCGQLVGSGCIAANGGSDVYYGSGSGGRIRIWLQRPGSARSDFSGTVEANGGTGGNPGNAALYDTPSTAAGTIVWQTTSDSPLSGDVWVVNSVAQRTMTNETSRVFPATQLPPRNRDVAERSYSETRWHLGNNARLRVTADVLIGSLELLAPTAGAESPVILTDGHVLKVRSLSLNGVSVEIGVYTSADYPEFIRGDGSVEVSAAGMVIVVR